jgi:hypothetical protein
VAVRKLGVVGIQVNIGAQQINVGANGELPANDNRGGADA